MHELDILRGGATPGAERNYQRINGRGGSISATTQAEALFMATGLLDGLTSRSTHPGNLEISVNGNEPTVVFTGPSSSLRRAETLFQRQGFTRDTIN